MPEELTCGVCHLREHRVLIKGIAADPPGWSHATLTGMPVLNRTLCPFCARAVRVVLQPADVPS
jgi:hypothetical protein